MFFGIGGALSFVPTILLAYDMTSIAWQIAVISMLTNVGLVISLSALDALYRASKTSAPATMLTFASLAVGAALGLMPGGSIGQFWYFIAAPALVAVLAGVMAGSGKKQAH